MLMGSSNCKVWASVSSRSVWRAPHIVEAEEAAFLALADADERGQRWQPLRLKPAGRAAVDLGRQLAQHADIVAGLEVIGGDQRLALDLVERVFDLGEAVGRIDVDEDEPGLGRRKLRDRPFRIVGRPD